MCIVCENEKARVQAQWAEGVRNQFESGGLRPAFEAGQSLHHVSEGIGALQERWSEVQEAAFDHAKDDMIALAGELEQPEET